MNKPWPIEYIIECPFCSCTIRSNGRHPNETAQSLARHLLHYHRFHRVGGEEE
tara:strand:+ start:50 stop:208 length:159 start_codon:yes stop_codon:yes gene_type:complete